MAQDYIIKIEGSWPSGETEYVIGTDNPERLPAVSALDNGDVLTVVEGKWQDAAPSAGGLPAVTAADNGDVLTVVDGAWNKAAPSGVLTKTPTTAIANETLSVAVEPHDGNYIISTTPVITVPVDWLEVAHNANIVATIDQHTYTFSAEPVNLTASSSEIRNGAQSNENENLSVSLWVELEDGNPTGNIMIAFIGWDDTIPETGTVTISVPSFDLVGASDELVTALTLLGVYNP